MIPPVEQLTKDGFDLQFGTNVVGHYLFTKLLITALRSAAHNGGHARVIHTSSSAAYMGAIDFDTFTDGPKRKKLGTQGLYSQSKLVRTSLILPAKRRV
jgi:retinol dehydrogenase 12